MLEGKKILPTKILVKRIERENKTTKAGLLLPTNIVPEETSVGEVVLVGTGTSSLPMTVKVGDKILYPPRAPQKVKIEDNDYYLVNLQDVLLYW